MLAKQNHIYKGSALVENHLLGGGVGNYTELQDNSLKHETVFLSAPFTTTGAKEF